MTGEGILCLFVEQYQQLSDRCADIAHAVHGGWKCASLVEGLCVANCVYLRKSNLHMFWGVSGCGCEGSVWVYVRVRL